MLISSNLIHHFCSKPLIINYTILVSLFLVMLRIIKRLDRFWYVTGTRLLSTFLLRRSCPPISPSRANWSLRRASNPRPAVYKAAALPSVLLRHMEWYMGLEPIPSVWKTIMLPIQHQYHIFFNGASWTRTNIITALAAAYYHLYYRITWRER